MKLDELQMKKIPQEELPVINGVRVLRGYELVFDGKKHLVMVTESYNGYERKRMYTDGELSGLSCNLCNEIKPLNKYKHKKNKSKGSYEGSCLGCLRKKDLVARIRQHNNYRKGYGKISSAEIKEITERFKDCPYCLRKINEDFSNCHIEHFIPFNRGGRNEVGNVLIVCADCNHSKNDSDFFEWSRGYFGYLHSMGFQRSPYQVQTELVAYFKEYYNIDYSDRINVEPDA